MAPFNRTLQDYGRDVGRCERMLREAASIREERWALAQLCAARANLNLALSGRV